MPTWLWTLGLSWFAGLIGKWWRARRLAYLKWFRGEVNALLDLTEAAFRETDPEAAKEKVLEVVKKTAEADPKVVAQVEKIVESKSHLEPLRPRQCEHVWDESNQKCLKCGVTFKEYDFQHTEGSGLRPIDD